MAQDQLWSAAQPRPDRVEGCRKTHFMNLKLPGRRERCTHGHEIVMPWRGFLQICTALSNLTDNQLTIQRIFDLTIGNSMLKYRTEKEFFSDREGKRRRKRDGKEEKHVIPCSCPRNHMVTHPGFKHCIRVTKLYTGC